MSHLTKGLFVLILIFVVSQYLFNRVKLGQEESRKEIYETAVRLASQYATMNIIDVDDINSLFDGVNREPMDLAINHDAIEKCRDALTFYLSSRANTIHSGVSNINVPLVGIVGYEAVEGELYDGTKLLPMTYDNGYTTLTGSNLPIRFTIGKKVFIGDEELTINNYKSLMKSDGTIIDCTSYLSGQGFTNINDLKYDVIMQTISKYIGMYCGSEYNKTTQNTEMGYDIYIGSTGFSENDNAFNTNPSRIRGLGVYAVIDLYTGSTGNTQFIRSVTFGGAELRLSVGK